MEIGLKKENLLFLDLNIEYKKNIFEIIHQKIRWINNTKKYDFSTLSTIKINAILFFFQKNIKNFKKKYSIFNEIAENKKTLIEILIKISKKNNDNHFSFLFYILEKEKKNDLDFWLIEQNLQFIIENDIKNRTTIELQEKINIFYQKLNILNHEKIPNEVLFFNYEQLLFFFKYSLIDVEKNKFKNKIITYFLNEWSKDLLKIDFNLFEDPLYINIEKNTTF